MKLSEYSLQLLKEWDYKKNSIDPQKIAAKSHKKVWWLCKNNHSWETVVYSRTHLNSGCPYCFGNKVTPEQSFANMHPDLVIEWDNDKNNITPLTVSPGSDKKVWWVCTKGHSWKTSIKHRTRNKSGCPYCKNKKISIENSFAVCFSNLLCEWNYEKNKLNPYRIAPKSAKKVWWKCQNNHEWEATVKSRTYRNRGCPKCSKRRSRPADKWLDLLGITNKEVYININGNKFFVDGFDSKTNTVYEYFGNFWHGNPDLYNANDIHPIVGKTFGELYETTINKISMLESAGYKVICKWGT